MSLKIVYGKSGTGKSEYIFNEIAKKVHNGADKKIYIITPEQFSFTAEKKLLESVGKVNSVISAEVVTFNRMAYRAINDVMRANSKTLSLSGKSMIIYDILLENKKE